MPNILSETEGFKSKRMTPVRYAAKGIFLQGMLLYLLTIRMREKNCEVSIGDVALLKLHAHAPKLATFSTTKCSIPHGFWDEFLHLVSLHTLSLDACTGMGWRWFEAMQFILRLDKLRYLDLDFGGHDGSRCCWSYVFATSENGASGQLQAHQSASGYTLMFRLARTPPSGQMSSCLSSNIEFSARYRLVAMSRVPGANWMCLKVRGAA
eukprot:1152609-Pelagomonas_calceolata.AAC.3